VSTTIERLLILQDRDRKLIQLERESQDVPKRKQEIEKRLSQQRQNLEKAQTELKHTQASMHQLEGDIEALKQKIAKFRQQQFEIKSNTEYKTLEGEIAQANKGIRKYEDREIELMEEAERIGAIVAEREKELAEAEERVREDQAVLDKRGDDILCEIQRLQQDRQALADDIDPQWLKRYQRILKHRGDFALVPVEHGSCCGGCHMKLTPQTVNDAKKQLSMTSCDYCGRLLYWPS
jgi:predicted  nucleic acid-binding Zn-ribbon protein